MHTYKKITAKATSQHPALNPTSCARSTTRSFLAVKVVDERLQPQQQDIEHGTRRVHPILLLADNELPSFLLDPAQRVRPRFSSRRLTLLFGLPASTRCDGFDGWEALGGIKFGSVVRNERSGMDDVVLRDGEAGEVVARVILIGTPGTSATKHVRMGRRRVPSTHFPGLSRSPPEPPASRCAASRTNSCSATRLNSGGAAGTGQQRHHRNTSTSRVTHSRRPIHLRPHPPLRSSLRHSAFSPLSFPPPSAPALPVPELHLPPTTNNTHPPACCSSRGTLPPRSPRLA